MSDEGYARVPHLLTMHVGGRVMCVVFVFPPGDAEALVGLAMIVNEMANVIARHNCGINEGLLRNNCGIIEAELKFAIDKNNALKATMR